MVMSHNIHSYRLGISEVPGSRRLDLRCERQSFENETE